ncbi:MAG TPA: FAD-dependent oxidoreductase [Patescibacteria group bacterium]|nr:FAD-dependent oxidoreductase [Patescibacteria group bacterium]
MSVFKIELLQKEKVADDAYLFVFEKPVDFNFSAGQYLEIKLNIDNPDDRGSARYFTIASSPSEENLMIVTRILDSTFKKKLVNLEIGEVVEMDGPYGNFILDEKEGRKIIFISGGTGITQARSMIIYAKAKKIGFKIQLISSFRKKGDYFFEEEMADLNDKKFSSIFFPDYSHEALAQQINKNVTDIYKVVYYISGSGEWVLGAEALLKDMGVSADRIKFENLDKNI